MMDSSPNIQPAPERRSFFAQLFALVSGAVCLVVPAVVGAAAALNPLRQKGRSGQLLKIATLDVLPADGTPRRFPVVADRQDAWNKFTAQPIGAVFLRRTGDPRQPVVAFHAVCPHAGCVVQYEAGAEGGRFFCPCHAASFDLDGRRREAPSISPRDLDTLEVVIENQNEVWVRFQNFATGTSEKRALA